jgi:two-component system sensor histidine kinase YesM
MRRKKRISVKKKLMSVYLPLMVCSVIIVSVVAYSLFSREMERAAGRYAKQTADMIARHLETYMQELERLTLFPYFHPSVMDLLRNRNADSSLEETYREYKLFEDLFNNIMLNPREDLLNVFLYREDGKRYFNTRVHVQLNKDYDWKSSGWYLKTLQSNGGVVYTANTNRDDRFDVFPYETFSISRLIISEKDEILGTILIDANFQGVAAILRDVGLGPKANVVLKDENGAVMFSQNGLYLDQLQQMNNAGTAKFSVDGETLFAGTSLSEKTGWTIEVVVPLEETFTSYSGIIKLFVWLLVAVGLITTVVTLRFSHGIIRPLQSLLRMIRSVEKGNYDVNMKEESTEELEELRRSFIKMSNRIKALIHEVYEFNIRQKEAELNNLKMQIRPHFLYNTLEAIRSLAEIRDNHEIVEMASSLGSILRYSIKTHKKLVLLGTEIDFISKYMRIYQIMLQGAIEVEYEIDPDLYRYYTIPLMLQPLVENAVQHGLYGKKRGGLIRIEGWKEGDHLHVVVSDNGKGIPPDKLEELNRTLKKTVPQTAEMQGGIGLNNVNQRIKIVFGKEYGIHLNSNLGSGTSVHIHIPAVLSEQQYAETEGLA